MKITTLHDDSPSVQPEQLHLAPQSSKLRTVRATCRFDEFVRFRATLLLTSIHSVTYPLTILVGELRQIWRTAGTSASTEPTCTIAQRWLHTVLIVSRSLV